MTFLKLNRKGQLTPFIIIGVLIVIVAGVVLFINRDTVSTSNFRGVQADPIRDYIEECMQEVLDESLIRLKENAGHYVRVGDANTYGYSYLTPGTHKPTNALERQISDDTKIKLENDCDLDVFSSQFSDIRKGEVNAETHIGLHEATVIVNYPIIVFKGEDRLEISDFFVTKEDDFGIMNEIANKIVNDEADPNRGFDCANWKVNSIFKEEEVDVFCSNEPEGRVFGISTPFDSGEYNFIVET